jgi:4-methyl-5(b-hydroxyethyl)-thiazole monophosphate biosynthesis
MTKVIIILADGFDETAAVVSIGLLRRAEIEVLVAGLGKKQIRSVRGVEIIADEIFDAKNDYGDFEAIILPGGAPGTANLLADDGVLNCIRKFFKDEKLCCAICAAPKVFDKAGILKNRNFTCFPTVAKEIKSGNYFDDAVVQDENVLTSKAAGTAIDFSLVIIENLLDEETAQEVIDKIYY